MAGKVETIASELERRLCGLRLGLVRQRLGDTREQTRLVRSVDAIGVCCARSGRRHDQGAADRSPQLLDGGRVFSSKAVGREDRERDPVEASAAGFGRAFGHLGAIAAAGQELRKTRSESRVPTDDYDPATHGGRPALPDVAPKIRRRRPVLPACYSAVIRR